MEGSFLTNTTPEGLKALGSASQRSYELISGTVQRRLGRRHANLFAEPVGSEHGDRVDWYAPVPGKATRLNEVDDVAVAAQARSVLDEYRREIRAEARAISSGGEAENERLAEALENALEVPDDKCIYLVELPDKALQPVLVNWAWTSDRQLKVRGTLGGADSRGRTLPEGAANRAAVVASAAPMLPPPRRSEGSYTSAWWLIWFGWLGVFALLAAILYLMLPACGLRLPFLPDYCPVQSTRGAPEIAATLVLEDEIAQLQYRLAEADRACQPLAQVREPAALPAPAETQSDTDRRLEEAGAWRGRLAFSLAWDTPSDLDMHVTCPSEQTISYRHRLACGGRLDVDANATAPRSVRPVENVYFDVPDAGLYRVRVKLYSSASGGAPERFRLQIRESNRVQVLQGIVRPGSVDWSTTYLAGNE